MLTNVLYLQYMLLVYAVTNDKLYQCLQLNLDAIKHINN